MFTSTSPLRAGIIGGGFMAETHARAVRAAGAVVSVATASTPERAHAAQDRTRAEHRAASADELIERDDVDVVHICSPNALHEAFAIRAAEAGKQIVCEKPLATTGEAAQRIVSAAQQSGVAGTVPFVYRFHPMVREMRSQILGEALGTPSVIHGSYLQDWLADPQATNWRVDPSQGGLSRAFADIGSHWFDLLEFVTGDRIKRLSAQSSTPFHMRGGTEAGNEDAMSVHFSTERGVIGSMVVSQIAAGRKNRLHVEISGSKASFAFDQEEPEGLWRGGREVSERLVRASGSMSAEATRLAFLPSGHAQGYQDAFNAFMQDTYDHFTSEVNPAIEAGLPKLEDGLRAAQICDAALASSSREGAWVSLDPQAAHTSQPVS